MDNAVRYIEKDGVVAISLIKKGRNVVVEVKDNGVGIPQDDQKYIFQKFFRSKNALRYQTQGSGLGLYIVKSIAEKLGGDVRFKSQEGVGSTFWLILPIKS
jgi:signal transduction histidine kinase